MNDIDGGVGMLAIQFLIFLGAVEGHLEFCIVILMAEMMLIILAIPAVILWGIKTIFGRYHCCRGGWNIGNWYLSVDTA